MVIATFYIFKVENYGRLLNSIFILILPILGIGYYIKENYFLNLANLNSWYIDAYYSMIDTYLYGSLYLLLSVVIYRSLSKDVLGEIKIRCFYSSFLLTFNSFYISNRLKKNYISRYFYSFLYLTAFLVKRNC